MRYPNANEPTRYEFILTNGERNFRVGYTPRKDRQTRWSLLIQHFDQIKALGIDITRPVDFGKRSQDAWDLGGGWCAKWSGRTQREACGAGEYPWLGSYSAPKQENAA